MSALPAQITSNEAKPRVEVQLRVTPRYYLSGQYPLNFTLLCTLRDSEHAVKFLKQGLEDDQGTQPISSENLIECIDDGSGETIPTLFQDRQLSFLTLEPDRQGYVTFTTIGSQSYQLGLDPSSFTPDHTYRFRLKPLSDITHWPVHTEQTTSTLSDRSGDISSMIKPIDLPELSGGMIPWGLADLDDDGMTFRVWSSPPETPKVQVSLSAPSTFSLSNDPPFEFTLTFTTNNREHFTALAERENACGANTDVEILDAATRDLIGPEPIDDGNQDGFWEREDFLEIRGTYTETRTVAVSHWNGLEDLQVGKEYVLRHLPGEWSWWTKDTLDEVMTYVGRGDLGGCEKIKFASAGEARFRVVP